MHVHVVIHAEAQEPVSAMMRLAAGCIAGQYNQRKGRRGGLWDGRFRCTAVESGENLWNCLAYVDMNMVPAGVVGHSVGWDWCGYREVAGLSPRKSPIEIRKNSPGNKMRWYVPSLPSRTADNDYDEDYDYDLLCTHNYRLVGRCGTYSLSSMANASSTS